MPKMIFVNLPVADLAVSTAFYKAVGATQNPIFSDDATACLVLSETICIMLLAHAKFATFTPRPIADAHAMTEVLLALSEDSRDAVDATMAKALADGGREPRASEDHGFMYGRAFEDPDGHIWELVWMDPAVASGEARPAPARG